MTIQKKENATHEVVVYKIYITVYSLADNSSIYAQGNRKIERVVTL
jgi:hypothetical protein